MAETEKRNARKVVTGTVVSISGDKSITVKIDYRKRHPKYGKMMTTSKKLHAHDEKNECGVGDLVTVMETRPLSKTKRWRLVEIVERAKKVSVTSFPCASRVWAHLWVAYVRRNTNDSDGDHAQRR